MRKSRLSDFGCAKLLEHILTRHYKIKGRDLDKIIMIAEAQYPHFEQMDLHAKRKLANKIMHKFERQSEVKDRVVVELFDSTVGAGSQVRLFALKALCKYIQRVM